VSYLNGYGLRRDNPNPDVRSDGKPHGVSGSESLKHSRRASRDVLQPAVDSSNQFKVQPAQDTSHLGSGCCCAETLLSVMR
jgi:hypothetical protein